MTVVDYRSSKPLVAAAPAKHVGPVSIWELVALAVLFGVYLITMAIVGDQGTFAVNVAGPVAFSLVLAVGVVPPAMRDANTIWTPLFWFRVAATVYFGFGNIVPFFLNSSSQDSVARYFNEYMDLITKLNAVSAFGMLLALGSAYVTDRMLYQKRVGAEVAETPGVDAQKNLVTLGTVFVVGGLLIKFVFVLPTALGVRESLLPGSVTNLAMLSDAGIYMLAVWAWKYRPGMIFIPFVLAGLEVFFGLLEFNKSEVIAPVLVLALGWLSKGITIRRLLITTGALAAIFALIVPFVTSGRNEMLVRYQSLGGAGVVERTEIAGYYFEPSHRQSDDDLQTGLLRLSYVGSATFALSLFDSGEPGGTLATLPATFVPRVLWPDKPNMTIIGSEFNEKATGNAGSASSPGWIAEAYWDYGWLGLPIIMIPLGFILQVWSGFALGVMRSGNWIFFPLCLLGMRAGISVDGFVVPNMMGPMVMTLVAYWALRGVEQVYLQTSTQAAPISSRQR